ncbi:MAG: lysophospholipid acyltransferase family protein [Gemmatimonadaceae bacterium]|nr:lysophospholipid acyltransferase family protein [Gemmatimonadaceae bacterium]
MTVDAAPSDGIGDARSVADARKARWLSLLGTGLIRMIGATWRVRIIDAGPIDRLRHDGHPVALLLWHGQLLPLLYVMRFQSIACLISTHKDGELIAQVARRLGCKLIRGSSSRGADRALLGLVRTLRDGFTVAVTPDGPRGPYRTFAPGALVAAHRAGAPVVAFGVFASRAWYLKSWDRFMIPKPFARLTIVFDSAQMVTGESARDAADAVPFFIERMAVVGARAAG